MGVIDHPFEKGDELTANECLEYAEFVIQGAANTFRSLTGMITDGGMGDPEDRGVMGILLGHTNTATRVAAEFRALAEAKREQEVMKTMKDELLYFPPRPVSLDKQTIDPTHS